jgi:Uncharacterised nucleotidyltransferase
MARRSDDPPLISLLQVVSQGRENARLAALNAEAIHWAIQTGLGPLLYQTTKADADAVASPLWMALKSADLTAQVIAGEHADAMCEILQACEPLAPPLTLLKGISICEQYYPRPHLRPMRDLDFLVEEAVLPLVESVLLELGYRQRSKSPAALYEKHHHSMPFFHPYHGVWVEVHRGLFSLKSLAGTDKVFSLEHVKTQRLPSTFRGKTVMRLSDELQIVYIASHWAHSFQAIGGMVAMLDMIYLLQKRKGAIDWERLLGWLQGSTASTYLYLMLTYLAKYDLIDIDPEILRDLCRCQRSYRSIHVKILHMLIDRYYVHGSPFGRLSSLRNIGILWKTLLLPGSPFRNLLLVPCYLLLPWQVRKKFLF